MALNFQKTLPEALQNIGHNAIHQFLVHDNQKIEQDEIIKLYGDAKWGVVNLLNEKYSHLIKDQFDLHNWINHNSNDELAYFLNEVGNNCFNYAEHKKPHKFHLWTGKNGFVVGIEQQGKGFDAEHTHQNQIKDNEGAAFDFFRKCKSEIFFDDPKDARIVFMEFRF